MNRTVRLCLVLIGLIVAALALAVLAGETAFNVEQ